MKRYFLKKQVLVLALVFIVSRLSSQPFTEINLGLGITYESLFSFGDFDNDNDMDFIFGGTIYRNTAGNFASFLLLGNADANAWGDYDNDGDLDVLLSGSGAPVLFRNNGSSTFTNLGISFITVSNSSCQFLDYDNDGDLDIIISGKLSTGDPSTEIYRNDKSDKFTLVTTDIKNLGEGYVNFGDFDNDFDNDIAESGQDFNGNPYSAIFRKEKGDIYTQVNQPFTGAFRSTTLPVDYNCDNNLDLLISGNWDHSDLYKNNGNNSFTKVTSGILGLLEAEADWGDYDNDGYLDLAISGAYTSAYIQRTRIYRNNHTDSFTYM